jgi:17beta-estradiol 17-dehydrogenase / very-long-chain 3-oxoacyl-CoA reductase
VSTKIIEADFTDDSYEAYHTIEKQLYGLEIGVLINNVGMTYPHPEYFLELPDRGKIYSNIIKCNICSVTSMTQIILPQMVERKKGVVVNVSSATAIIPSPLLTVYGASKVSS